MNRFVSTYINKIDAKGRTSIPQPFRGILTQDGFDGQIYCYPSLDNPALDAGGQKLVDRIDGIIEELLPYSDERDPLATALFGESEIIKIDQDGRAIISERLRKHAGLTGEVTFVGLGHKFQMWEPRAFENYRAQSRSKMDNLRKRLGAGGRPAVVANRDGEQGAQE